MAFWIWLVYLSFLTRSINSCPSFSQKRLLKFLILSKGHDFKMSRYHTNRTVISLAGLNAEQCPQAEITTWTQYLLTFGVCRAEISVCFLFFLIVTCRMIWAFERVIVCGRGRNIEDWLFHLLLHDLTSRRPRAILVDENVTTLMCRSPVLRSQHQVGLTVGLTS